IVAVVQLSQGTSFEKVRIELAEHCASRLSRVKQPSSFVELAELPRTTSGKIQKAKLRAWLTGLPSGTKNGEAALDAALPLPLPVSRPGEDAHSAFLKPSKVVSDITEAMSIKYNTRVYELRSKNEDVIVLSLGEAFFDIPLYPFD